MGIYHARGRSLTLRQYEAVESAVRAEPPAEAKGKRFPLLPFKLRSRSGTSAASDEVAAKEEQLGMRVGWVAVEAAAEAMGGETHLGANERGADTGGDGTAKTRGTFVRTLTGEPMLTYMSALETVLAPYATLDASLDEGAGSSSSAIARFKIIRDVNAVSAAVRAHAAGRRTRKQVTKQMGRRLNTALVAEQVSAELARLRRGMAEGVAVKRVASPEELALYMSALTKFKVNVLNPRQSSVVLRDFKELAPRFLPVLRRRIAVNKRTVQLTAVAPLTLKFQELLGRIEQVGGDRLVRCAIPPATASTIHLADPIVFHSTSRMTRRRAKRRRRRRAEKSRR